MNSRQVVMPVMTEEQRRVHRAGEALHRDGASPAGALELLAAIIEDRTWEKVADSQGVPFEGRFRDFVSTRTFGLGYDPDQLPKVLELRHPREELPAVAHRMALMRQEVRRLLLEEIPAAERHGGGRKRQERTTLLEDRSETAARHIQRLKRDDPELAEKVINGEITAYAAARAKGWKPPRIQVTTPERTAAHLRRHMSADDLAKLAALLQEVA